MMNCLDRDLDATLASSGFGEASGAVRNGDTANPIPGIFDDEDVETQNGEGNTILVRQITYTCASSKVSGLADGDTLVVRDVTYTVRFWKNDGSGEVEIHLEGPDRS